LFFIAKKKSFPTGLREPVLQLPKGEKPDRFLLELNFIG
jgi:hypothetical protein